jgi:hypothetical protein
MRGWREARVAATIPLIACSIASCGGSSEPPPPPPGKTVVGQTETGMQLKVETFFSPSKDPRLKQIEDWRAAGRYPAVDYHRVTADNTNGQIADGGRTVSFARSPEAIATGQAIQGRFTCEALEFEWLPQKPADTERWEQVRNEICADGPPKAEAIGPGERLVYYLVTDRTFGERGIRGMRVFGPRSEELKQQT